MDIEPLVNLTSRAIATQVSGKSTDEIRETFYNANCDIHSSQFATRYRLQKRIRNKANKDEAPPAIEASTVEGGRNEEHYWPPDDRSVEDILTFINSNTPSSRGQKKKRQKAKKEQSQAQAQVQQPLQAQQPSTQDSQEADIFSEGRDIIQLFWYSAELFQEEERAIDPDFKAKVDKEVEEWRQKLEQISKQYQGPKVKLPTDIYLSSIGVQ